MAGLLARLGLRSPIRTASSADTPPSGQRALIARSDGWYDRNAAGTELRLGMRFLTGEAVPDSSTGGLPGDWYVRTSNGVVIEYYRFT